MIHTCANNLCGHGFYQFSPELFYRALSAENGFEVRRLVMHRVGPYGAWYEVANPNRIRERVELISFMPVQMLVHARRVALKDIFARLPQQSDYIALWQAGGQPPAAGASTGLPLPAALARLVKAVRTGLEFYRRQSLFNRRFFTPTAKGK